MVGEQDVATARQWLAQANSIAVLTGAGISAESGIPTFRGPGGLWRSFRPEELATPEAFTRDPRLVWEWYLWRRSIIAGAEPNAGHLALARLEARFGDRFTLVTQNVDGLHDRAGSRRILKIHGDIWLTRCNCCVYQRRDRVGASEPLPPICPECEGPLRPGVVWFGETLPRIVWAEAERAVAQSDLLLVVGTSALVYPAAGLLQQARRVVEINLEETPYSEKVALSLRGACGQILPRLIPDESPSESS